YQRNQTGWVVQGEEITNSIAVTNMAAGVTTLGTVILAYKCGSGPDADICTATRVAANNWTQEDISYDCCTGCVHGSGTYLPGLAADPTGGMRATWAEERCDPRTDP